MTTKARITYLKARTLVVSPRPLPRASPAFGTFAVRR